ncbi:band 4.1-like protein 4 isoform X3 [Tribolium castaneum]|uniref:band 4.1-like protein 4 isoform X3 n=1 Tax=Tribolium castaneum TaxID=7070 RepID=UPI00077DC454|nr:PREDICTED: band 4.1-like protein 4 isoform X2 [Tribolium castaneum]|eukprot:XP_015835298.1 PREDICTED: band 4.1-like protein 4 isoform X2 [Tribolium castaneum]
MFLLSMDCICSKPRVIHCKIILLDEQELIHEIEDSCTGQALLDVVFRNLNLLETAYFGLRYLDQTGQTHWLDPAKTLSKQIKGPDPFTFYFGVKFYAADPCKLLEEITRYQFFLQVKQDILQERLLVPFELAAELGAYVVQSELGDYDPRRHSKGYVSEFRFLPNQSIDLETRIAEIHKTLVGQLPSVAELNYLEKVKWLEMYGVDLHPVLGEDSVEYFLGLTPSGIIVLRNKTTVGNYYWPRITKIYFKGRYFMLRVIDKNNDESTYGFETPSKSGCKHLWKCCVEHHAFFRLVQVTPTTPDIFALGSRFRYSGRTEKQAVRDAQMKVRTPPAFSRTPSRRYQRRVIEGIAEHLPTDETYGRSQYQPQPQETKFISVPQPAQNFGGSHPSFNANSDETKRADSPRSIKSAPWSQPHSKGLYNNSVPISPRSVRSAGPRYRSSSLDSQSSNDSRSCKKRKHRSKLTSDNESELSKSSNRSHRKHRRRRSKSRRDSESEPESERKYSSKLRQVDHQYELVNSDYQWREVQKKLYNESTGNSIQQANVISSRRSCQQIYDGKNECEMIYPNKVRKHRKHRSRSRSPSEPKSWLSDELKKHLEFDLIDTTGMSDSQLKEIPYTVVQTNKPKQIKLKPQWNKSIHDDKKCNTPPPPYSPHITETHRIRNVCLGHYNLNEDLSPQLTYNGNDNSADAVLPRMFSSLEVADFPNNFSHHPKSYNPGLERRQENSDHLGISHEHTDSGLGTEQDCIYNSEKSNERNGFNNVEDYLLVSGPERLSNVTEHNALPQANSEGGGASEATAAVDLSEMSTEL